MRHLISILLQNEAGALARVAGLFAARGYNIESLTVAATGDEEASRLSLVVYGDDAVVEQIVKQSRKLVDVISIEELTTRQHVERELVVVRFAASGLAWANSHARVLSSGSDQCVAEFSGHADDVDEFLTQLAIRATVHDVARSGLAALAS
ncbi:acetolactate synthase small subunit [Pinirhizobacter soli]|uniref:acetolactate synthase small subunit n=1 Tax=Pinirhizobacter soli TaxID=2786953 RepID=UPI00202A7ABF|nr:acetolactate synthase small subunit [Pinirhizobacter soli]